MRIPGVGFPWPAPQYHSGTHTSGRRSFSSGTGDEATAPAGYCHTVTLTVRISHMHNRNDLPYRVAISTILFVFVAATHALAQDTVTGAFEGTVSDSRTGARIA